MKALQSHAVTAQSNLGDTELVSPHCIIGDPS